MWLGTDDQRCEVSFCGPGHALTAPTAMATRDKCTLNTCIGQYVNCISVSLAATEQSPRVAQVPCHSNTKPRELESQHCGASRNSGSVPAICILASPRGNLKYGGGRPQVTLGDIQPWLHPGLPLPPLGKFSKLDSHTGHKANRGWL